MSACHRDRLIPRLEPAGSTPLHQIPLYIGFRTGLSRQHRPGSSVPAGWRTGGRPTLDRSGRVDWTGYPLGPRRREGLGVGLFCTQLIEAFLRRWPTVVAAERAAYGFHSHFNRPSSPDLDLASGSELGSVPSSDDEGMVDLDCERGHGAKSGS